MTEDRASGLSHNWKLPLRDRNGGKVKIYAAGNHLPREPLGAVILKMFKAVSESQAARLQQENPQTRG